MADQIDALVVRETSLLATAERLEGHIKGRGGIMYDLIRDSLMSIIRMLGALDILYNLWRAAIAEATFNAMIGRFDHEVHYAEGINSVQLRCKISELDGKLRRTIATQIVGNYGLDVIAAALNVLTSIIGLTDEKITKPVSLVKNIKTVTGSPYAHLIQPKLIVEIYDRMGSPTVIAAIIEENRGGIVTERTVDDLPWSAEIMGRGCVTVVYNGDAYPIIVGSVGTDRDKLAKMTLEQYNKHFGDMRIGVGGTTSVTVTFIAYGK